MKFIKNLGLTIIFCVFTSTAALGAASAPDEAEKEQSREYSLIKAVNRNDTKTVELLLILKTNPNTCDVSQNANVLHMAIANNSYDIAKLLVENGANVNATDAGKLLLKATSRKDYSFAKALIERSRANLGATDAKGRTPLHIAAFKNSPTLVDLFLAFGANANAVDAEGRTPSQIAESLHYSAIVEVITSWRQ